MSHRKMQSHLLLYVDGELTDRERTAVDRHLSECADCRAYLSRLKSVWQAEPPRPRTPPSYLWARVEAGIRGQVAPRPFWPSRMDRLAFMTRPALMAITLIAGILVGAYLGDLSSTTVSSENPAPAPDPDSVLNASYLETFQDLPPESVDGIYLAGAAEE